MKYPSLTNLIEQIKSSKRVVGIFTTGTTATKMNSSSDIDLVVVLDKNSEDIKSIYTIVEERFSDIFFFDTDFINQLEAKREVSGNDFEGIFLDWLAKGKIEYDPENILLKLKEKISKNQPSQYIADSEKKDFWVRINYNFIANSRYFSSEDKIYHQALEFRLLYSIIELITAYFSFRDIPWRGEKAAVKYLEQNDPEFLATFQKYSESSTLDEEMKYYVQLFNKSFFGKYQKWEEDFIIPISYKNGYDKNLLAFWSNLLKEQM
jgi:hypothetical protein